MKNETLEEARDRLKAMGEAEREGARAAIGDQVNPIHSRDPALDQRAEQINAYGDGLLSLRTALDTNPVVPGVTTEAAPAPARAPADAKKR